MAPPTEKPRLGQIEERTLEASWKKRLNRAIERMGFAAHSKDIVVLCRFAKTGKGPSPAQLEFLSNKVKLLCQQLDIERASPIRVVLRAAHCRRALASGESVSAAELAALAELSERQIGQLARNGQLVRVEGRYRADSALSWLKSRRVPGV